MKFKGDAIETVIDYNADQMRVHRNSIHFYQPTITHHQTKRYFLSFFLLSGVDKYTMRQTWYDSNVTDAKRSECVAQSRDQMFGKR